MRPHPSERKYDDLLMEEDKQISEAQEEEFAVPKLNLEDVPELSMALAQLRLKTCILNHYENKKNRNIKQNKNQARQGEAKVISFMLLDGLTKAAKCRTCRKHRQL